MTPADELLAAVLANPADDLCRLVYADALDECGEVARAAWIRYSIEAELKPTIFHPSMAARMFVLVDDNIRVVTIADAVPGVSLVTHHGFISELRGPLASLLRHGGEVAAVNPVERFIATDREPASNRYSEPTDERHWIMASIPAEMQVRAEVLPYEVVRAMDDEWPPALFFPTRDAAMTALSEAVGRVVRAQPIAPMTFRASSLSASSV